MVELGAKGRGSVTYRDSATVDGLPMRRCRQNSRALAAALHAACRSPPRRDTASASLTARFWSHTVMTFDEALDWIQQVDGTLYQNPMKDDEDDEWIAVVRMPPAVPGRSEVIITSGRTLQQATSAAEQQWNHVWEKLGPIH